MGKSAVSDYDTVIETETQSLARNLVQNDTNITAQLRLSVHNFIGFSPFDF